MQIWSCLLLFAASAWAANNDTQKYVKVDFVVDTGDSNSTSKTFKNSLSKRGSKEIEISGDNEYYAVTLKVGSQRSNNVVALDTGSSDLWIMASDVKCFYSANTKRSIEEYAGLLNRRAENVELKASPTEEKARTKSSSTTIGGTCTAEGAFNTDTSDSFRANTSTPPFHIVYGDWSYARGIWGSDTIQVGSVNVSNVNFAVANDSSSNTGVFGIGLPGDEASNSPYVNFPMQLKRSGAVERNVYSLYLTKADKSVGSVLFGGVDHSRYSGKLQTVPLLNIYPDQSQYPSEFDIALHSITLESSTQNVTVFNSSMATLLDSGTSLSYLPAPIVKAFGKSLHGVMSGGYYRVSCDYRTDSRFAVFNFSGAEIHVPLSSLISTSGSHCYLGIGSNDYDPKSAAWGILGDNFLRNAYVVYDLENYEVSLAPIKFSNSDDIEVVTSTIPGAVKAPHYSSTSLATPIVTNNKPAYFRPASSKKSQGSTGYQLPKSSVVGAVVLCFVFLFWT